LPGLSGLSIFSDMWSVLAKTRHRLSLFVRPAPAAASSAARAGVVSGPPSPDSACVSLPGSRDSVMALALVELRIAPVVTDSTSKLRHEQRTDTLPAAFAALVIETLRQHFVVPPTIGLGVLDGRDTTSAKPQDMWPSLGVHAYFTLRLGKPPADVALGGSSMSRVLEQRVADAIFALHGDSLPPLPGGAEELRVELRIRAEQDKGAADPAALFRIRLPVYRNVRLPQRLGGPGPQFPDMGAIMRVADTIVVDFVIDRRGVPIESTFDIIRGTYKDFSQSVLRALPRTRSRPLVVGGCAVPFAIRQTFSFRF
jgi:hypothetical protein